MGFISKDRFFGISGTASFVVNKVAKLKAGLEAGVKADVVDEDGVSALMMAATQGGAEACEAQKYEDD